MDRVKTVSREVKLNETEKGCQARGKSQGPSQDASAYEREKHNEGENAYKHAYEREKHCQGEIAYKHAYEREKHCQGEIAYKHAYEREKHNEDINKNKGRLIQMRIAYQLPF
jgi:hypothetical protein